MNVQHDDPAAAAMRLTALGGILGAIAASACCIAPLVLFGLGISGAWIGNLTALAPYQPYFVAVTLACLGYGYWLVYRREKIACREGAACARPLPSHVVKAGLVLATILVAGAIAFNGAGLLILRPAPRRRRARRLAAAAGGGGRFWRWTRRAAVLARSFAPKQSTSGGGKLDCTSCFPASANRFWRGRWGAGWRDRFWMERELASNLDPSSGPCGLEHER